jgi:RNA polymerase sigma factor (sigma-70 family)
VSGGRRRPGGRAGLPQAREERAALFPPGFADPRGELAGAREPQQVGMALAHVVPMDVGSLHEASSHRPQDGRAGDDLPSGRRFRFHSLVELTSLPDARVVARCRSGDQDAWRELVSRFSRYVYAICSQAFRLRQDDAEDVFQEVFARTYEHLDRLRDDEAIRPWIGQLTRRLCIDRLRAGSREELTGEDPAPPDVDETMELLDEAFAVHEALATLPENCREILDRFFAQDESYQTIGAALDIPAGTIASRISRCLGKLRTALEGRKPDPEPSS